MTADEIAELLRVVTVRPLEWNEALEARPYPFWYATSSVGRYEIDEVSTGSSTRYDVFLKSVRFSIKENLAEAKAAAQADYEQHALSALTLVSRALPADRCEDCPPSGYPTDATRCDPCDRRALTVEEMPSAWQQRLKGRWHNLPEDWSKEECDRMPPGKVFRPLYAPDQLTRLCDQAKREAYARCAQELREYAADDVWVDIIEALAEKKP